MKEIEINKDIFESITRHLKEWLIDAGLPENLSKIVADYSGFLLVIAFAVVLFYIAKIFIVRWMHRLAAKSTSNWDDAFVDRKVFKRLAYLIPAMVIHTGAAYVIPDYPVTLSAVLVLIKVYMVTVLMIVVKSVLDASNDIYNSYEISKTRPIKGFIQVAKIFLFIVYIIVIITVLFLRGKGFGWIAGLGAFSAVLLLVFKDPILGFAGGIQLATNDMLRIGDWIEMPKYNADGTVLDITITTVKVQNWDNTITTIPTYFLVSDSYKNWRGMQESGARRIRRHILIDMTSVKFCTKEMLERFSGYQFVAGYISNKHAELEAYNNQHGINPNVMINGRRQTNIGIFRAYLTEYLKNNQDLRQDMTLMVRQLQPTEHGLPLEIYVFSKEQGWEAMENIQSDIFDHVLAGINYFDLKIFQSPSGADFQSFSNSTNQ
ncbi:MAG: mechanosensitive ion channel family protein [Bacteroidales bacterium]|jgi:miniconductance mechanosensitive channel|nr:mechanosensitive ion channel family protein [Bacteroidales bacterium]